MNDLLPFAKRMLTEYGEFHPFGGYIKNDGAIVHVGVTDPATEHPRGADLVDLLRKDFKRRARSGSINAAAIVLNASVTPPNHEGKSDAIEVVVEHKDGYSAEVFFPYRFRNAGTVEYGPIFAQRGEDSVFGDSGGSLS